MPRSPGFLVPDQAYIAARLQMINLATQYFAELMTNGNAEVCHHILSPDVEHKDMVGTPGCCCRRSC